MTYLLDTHTFLWQINNPEQLPLRVRDILADPSATLLISVIVPWEIAIKKAVGKIDSGDILDRFEEKVTRAGFQLMETTIRQVIRGGQLPLYHRDPFDRLLIAQALEARVSILSTDHVFDSYGVSRIWE